MDKLIVSGAVEPCSPTRGQFISPIFLVDKPNGDKRLILNLKRLNEFIEAPKFKLEDHRTVRQLIWKGAYATVIDITDAYYAVSICPEDRKYLRFTLDGKLFQFCCLPFGLSSAPYTYVKLMKPILVFLRSRGITCANYLDDFLILSDSPSSCTDNTMSLVNLLNDLGFRINSQKSRLSPAQIFTFLGFEFNSLELSISLPVDKKVKTKRFLDTFIEKPTCTIRDFAVVIGILVSICPATPYGWSHLKTLERVKEGALLAHGGDYEASINIPSGAHSDLNWWSTKLLTISDSLRRDHFTLSFDSDSSLTGWGAVSGTEEVSGWWTAEERLLHINVLELKAIFLALQHFARSAYDTNILIRSDNKTAIACVNRQGTVRSQKLLDLSHQIWEWCELHNIFIRATYISSSDNHRADRASRRYPLESEWSLAQNIFDYITQRLGRPDIDLFASSATTKCHSFVSWVPEPHAVAIDAFTISWSNLKFYAFPPFPLLLRTLRKIEEDQASGIVVAPNWPSQSWFPLFMSLVSSELIMLGPDSNMLYSPFSTHSHPLSSSLVLMAAKLSAKHSA